MPKTKEELLTADEATLTPEELAEKKKLEEGGEVIPPVVTPPTEELNEDGTPKETPPQPTIPPVVPPVTPEKKDQPIDYKKKFGDSTRRNQIVESQFKELQKILGDITKTEVPTDDEMVAQVADWEYLSDREKNSERKLVVLERRQNHMMNTFSTIASETENASKLDEFISSEPRLAGKEEAFYDFVSKPANKGASMEVLVNAFLFEVKPDTTTVVTPPPPEEIPPSLERGTGGGAMPPENTGTPKYSDEELKVMRTKDPRKYHDLIRKGVI